MTEHTDASDRYLVISSDTHAGPPAAVAGLGLPLRLERGRVTLRGASLVHFEHHRQVGVEGRVVLRVEVVAVALSRRAGMGVR